MEYAALGATATAELLPGGAATPVTSSNRHQFVALYADWLLNASVAPQFGALAAGFYRVVGGPALSMFRCAR